MYVAKLLRFSATSFVSIATMFNNEPQMILVAFETHIEISDDGNCCVHSPEEIT